MNIRTAPSRGHDRIYIHGEKETERKAKSLVEGVTIDDGEIKMLDILPRSSDSKKCSTAKGFY